jgi:hypothetical protein
MLAISAVMYQGNRYTHASCGDNSDSPLIAQPCRERRSTLQRTCNQRFQCRKSASCTGDRGSSTASGSPMARFSATQAQLGCQRVYAQHHDALTFFPDQGTVWAVEAKLSSPTEVGTSSCFDGVCGVGLVVRYPSVD